MANHATATSSRPVKRTASTARMKAFDLIKEKSFFKGHFTLASGKVSDYYLDMKPTMFDPDGSRLLTELVLSRLEGIAVDLIGGLEMGAVPLISNIVMRSATMDRPIPGFFVRKSVKDHGTKKLIEGTSDIAGKSVVILDDVTTTGESAMVAVWAARNAGANVTLVLSVVDREEGAAQLFKKEGVLFDHLFTASAFLKS